MTTQPPGERAGAQDVPEGSTGPGEPVAPGPSEVSALPGSSDGPGVRVDRDRCIGAGLCVLAAPDVFDQSEEDGLVVVLGGTPPDPGDEAVRDAVRRCPSGALSAVPS